MVSPSAISTDSSSSALIRNDSDEMGRSEIENDVAVLVIASP